MVVAWQPGQQKVSDPIAWLNGMVSLPILGVSIIVESDFGGRQFPDSQNVNHVPTTTTNE